MRGWLTGFAVAAAVILVGSSAASAQHFKYNYCPPCYHPFYGAYPTCWSIWPPGWNCWNCGQGPVQGQGQITPPRRKLEEPEMIPAPRPEPNPLGMSRTGRFSTRLWR
jgi:hypothetical protein